MNVGKIIQGYAITGVANGYVMGKSVTAPNPYVTWKIDHDGKGVSCGHYFNDREEAEWDLCARAFEWFEDNVNIHMIEDNESGEEPQKPLEQTLISGLRKIKSNLTAAAQLVDEMCAIADELKAERTCTSGSYNND